MSNADNGIRLYYDGLRVSSDKACELIIEALQDFGYSYESPTVMKIPEIPQLVPLEQCSYEFDSQTRRPQTNSDRLKFMLKNMVAPMVAVNAAQDFVESLTGSDIATQFERHFGTDIVSFACEFYTHARLLQIEPGPLSLTTFLNYMCKHLGLYGHRETIKTFMLDTITWLVNKLVAFSTEAQPEGEDDVFTSQTLPNFDFIGLLCSKLEWGSTILEGASTLVNDQIWSTIIEFVSKISLFFSTYIFGVSWDDMQQRPTAELMKFLKNAFNSGADIVQTSFKAIIYIVKNFTKFFTGEATIFCGQDEIKNFEKRYAKIISLEAAGTAGDLTILALHDFTIVSYEAEVDKLLDDVNRLLKTRSTAQKQCLTNWKIKLHVIRDKLDTIQREMITRAEPFSIALIGGSGVGKSTITPALAKACVIAAGEKFDNSLIVTGKIDEKFDSNELPRHQCIIYDDVGNSVQNTPDFDKILNVVNSQPRPFNKAEAGEKGKMFPGNTSAIISSNVPGFGADKASNEPESILRRFDYHVYVEVTDERVMAPGTTRVDPTLIAKLPKHERLSIWTFKVYKFITYDPTLKNQDNAIEALAHLRELHTHAYYELVETIVGSPELNSLSRLRSLLGKACHAKLEAGKARVDEFTADTEDLCKSCFYPVSECPCIEFDSQSDNKVFALLREYYIKLDMLKAVQTKTDYWVARASLAKVQARLAFDSQVESVDNRLNNVCADLRCGQEIFQAMKIAHSLIPLFRRTAPVFLCALIGLFGLKITMMLFAVFALYVGGVSAFVYRSRLKEAKSTSFLLSIPIPTEVSSCSIGLKLIAFIGTMKLIQTVWNLYYACSFTSQDTPTDRMTEALQAEKYIPRTTKARTTTSIDFMEIIRRNVARVEVEGQECSAVCVGANIYATVNHLFPATGEFEVRLKYEKENNVLAAREKLAQHHIRRFEDRDLALFYIPSSQPRKSLQPYLPGKLDFPKRPNLKVIPWSAPQELSAQASGVRKNVKMSRVEQLIDVHTYTPQNFIPEQGDCGSPILDVASKCIVGFHIGFSSNNELGAYTTLTHQEVETARLQFQSQTFIPHNEGDLNTANLNLDPVSPDSIIHLSAVDDPQYYLAPTDHNLCVFGTDVHARSSSRGAYIKHPMYKTLVEEFGPPTHIPPQHIDADRHKRKAVTNLAQPNQAFSQSELDHAVDDYLAPILEMISKMTSEEKAVYNKPLSDQEKLDGTPGQALNSINNSTSCGFPYRGKKKDYMLMEDFDSNIPIMPRTLIPNNGVDFEVECNNLVDRYRSGEASGVIHKASMKTNELLPADKIKARTFFGCSFPFLLVCRKYLGAITNLMREHRYLFEMGKGLDMTGKDADEFCKYFLEYSKSNCVALDHRAFDQKMGAQVSTKASYIILKIMEALGCEGDQMNISRGVLTDINYPHILYHGSVFSLANSNPSGQPLTTELNGIVNSLYLRILFFRIYPEFVKQKVAYRSCIRSMTFGDDNISTVKDQFSKFNGVNIVDEGLKVGLEITMAVKDAEVTKFTDFIDDSDFLKFRFRFCPEFGHYRAYVRGSSLTKAFYFYKKETPLTPEQAFAENVETSLRAAARGYRSDFEALRAKLLRVADAHGLTQDCMFWTYDQRLRIDKRNFDVQVESLTFDSQTAGAKLKLPYTPIELRESECYTLSTIKLCFDAFKTNTVHDLFMVYMMINEKTYEDHGHFESWGIYLIPALIFTPLTYLSLYLDSLALLAFIPVILAPLIEEYIKRSRPLGTLNYALAEFILNPGFGRVLPFTIHILGGTLSYIDGVLFHMIYNATIVAWGVYGPGLAESTNTTMAFGVFSVPGFYFTLTSIILAILAISSDIRSFKIWYEEIWLFFQALLVPWYFFNTITDTLAHAPYVSAGRSEEAGYTIDSYISRLAMLSKIVKVRLGISSIIPAMGGSASQFVRYSYTLEKQQSELILSEKRDLVRKQPFGICLIGPPGSGKSGLTHALISAIYANDDTFNPSQVVALNETDEFQSEFRTHHRVVILDDIANSPPVGSMVAYASPENPFRKVIDFINNIVKVALNPTLESKGRVLIQPEIVIATSNMEFSGPIMRTTGNNPSGATILDAASIAPISILRRFTWVIVEKNPNFVKTKDGFDIDYFRLSLVSRVHCGKFTGHVISFPDLVKTICHRRVIHENSQSQFVNDIFDLYDRDWTKDLESAAILDFDLELYDRRLDRGSTISWRTPAECEKLVSECLLDRKNLLEDLPEGDLLLESRNMRYKEDLSLDGHQFISQTQTKRTRFTHRSLLRHARRLRLEVNLCKETRVGFYRWVLKMQPILRNIALLHEEHIFVPKSQTVFQTTARNFTWHPFTSQSKSSLNDDPQASKEEAKDDIQLGWTQMFFAFVFGIINNINIDFTKYTQAPTPAPAKRMLTDEQLERRAAYLKRCEEYKILEQRKVEKQESIFTPDLLDRITNHRCKYKEVTNQINVKVGRSVTKRPTFLFSKPYVFVSQSKDVANPPRKQYTLNMSREDKILRHLYLIIHDRDPNDSPFVQRKIIKCRRNNYYSTLHGSGPVLDITKYEHRVVMCRKHARCAEESAQRALVEAQKEEEELARRAEEALAKEKEQEANNRQLSSRLLRNYRLRTEDLIHYIPTSDIVETFFSDDSSADYSHFDQTTPIEFRIVIDIIIHLNSESDQLD